MSLPRVLTRPGYRRLWVARTASQCGDVFATITLALLVLDLTGSPLRVSGVVLAEVLPVLLFGTVAGTLLDRWPRVRVMVSADLVRASLATVLVVDAGSVTAVYLVSFGLASCTVLFNPSANSVLPTLVEERELVTANSGIWTAAVVAQILLAPVAGVLYSALGARPALAIDAASFVVSAAVLVRLRLPVPPARTGRPRWWVDALGGARLLARDRLLRALAAGQLLAALSAGATSALLVVLAREHLGLSSRAYGLLLAAIGFGAVLGPVLLGRLVADPRRPAFVFGPYLLRGAVDLVLATVTSLPPALLALVGYGIGTSTGAVTFTALVQAHTPAPVRGRVFVGFDVLWQLGRLVSLLVGGAFATAMGIRTVYYLGGVLLVTAAVVGWAGLAGRMTGSQEPSTAA